MSGVLYIVATPIGNLDDITLRAIKTLKEVDRIAAEDTRHTSQLLAHLGIKKPMISVHEHNERARISKITELLEQGENIALVSDAGTPLISDPGFPLSRAVIEQGFKVVPIPGVSSVITALSAAGLPTDQFSFVGFLPHKNAERVKKIQSLNLAQGTQILFESTHRIELLLEQINQQAPQLQVVLAKELTKRYERFIRGSAVECLDVLQSDPTLKKGEFVVLVYQTLEQGSSQQSIDVDLLLSRLLHEMPLKKAVKISVEVSGLKKNDLYQRALDLSASIQK